MTNTGTGSLFINAMGSGGLNQLDFTRTNDQVITLTGPGTSVNGPTPLSVDTTGLACGGFTVVRASVRNVNLPNGTVRWVTLGGGPIGRMTLANGAATMQPWTLPHSTLRKVSMFIYTQPPTGSLAQVPVLSGGFF